MTRGRLYLSLFWLLSLAVLVTILLAWLIFPWEIAELDLTRWVSLSAEDIKKNFDQLMVYLLTPWVNPLEMTDFSVSASGAKHFVDVKRLFLLAEGPFLALAVPASRGLMRAYRQRIFYHHKQVFLACAALPVAIAGFGLLIGFDNFFTLFHAVLFPGDSSWLFDPATDPVILILPAEFFLHCFLIFGGIYEAICLGLWYLARRQERDVERTR